LLRRLQGPSHIAWHATASTSGSFFGRSDFTTRNFIIQADDLSVGDVAWVDEREVVQAGGHVECVAVGGDASPDQNS